MYKKKVGLQNYEECLNILVLQFLATASGFWFNQKLRALSFRCQTCPEAHHLCDGVLKITSYGWVKMI